jgi:hypothetical protein
MQLTLLELSSNPSLSMFEMPDDKTWAQKVLTILILMMPKIGESETYAA